MNERITRLIIEANNYATKKHTMSDAECNDAVIKEMIVGNRISESQKKLAELIVLECAKIARVYSEEGVEFGGGDAIKEHSGVEE